VRTIKVNTYSERWLRRGFPWVYLNEIQGKQTLRKGEWVSILSSQGQRLGMGLADAGHVAVRVFVHGTEPFQPSILEARLDRALQLRRQCLNEKITGYRLVHAENDDIPGIRIDWWQSYAVIALDSPSLQAALSPIVSWLERTLSPQGVFLCFRPSADTPGESPAAHWIAGQPNEGPVTVSEDELNYQVHPEQGPDVGLYSDMRELRRFLQPHWKDRHVLNLFCYTGAFSVHAAAHGASSVTSVDLSGPVLERAKENFAVNELSLQGMDFIQADIFKALDRFRRKQHSFDLVLIDPPSFSHSGSDIWSAQKDYPRLVAAAARVLSDGGWLVAASNQGELSPKAFRGLVADGFRKANRSAQELWWGSTPPDFPAAVNFPEAHYLKIGLWRMS